jgi:hypothetical protein
MGAVYVTIGKTTFNKEEVLKLGYKDFKKTYGKIVKTSLDEAWIALGGKIEKPKTKTDEVREVE